MSTLVTVRPIRNDEDLDAALERLDAIFDALPGTPEGDEHDVLATLIQAYEREHYPIGPSDPIEALRFHMENQGLRQADLIPYLGASSRVSEILAGKRSLTVAMIRALHQGLGIPLESLVGAAQTA